MVSCQHRKGKGDIWAGVAGNTGLGRVESLCTEVKGVVMMHEAAGRDQCVSRTGDK